MAEKDSSKKLGLKAEFDDDSIDGVLHVFARVGSIGCSA
jgi:hypothetical protein